MTQIDPLKIPRLAAAFAISNMGQVVPEDMSTVPHNPYSTPRSQVDSYVGHFMETDEHEQIFADEAEMWAETLTSRTQEEVLSTHGSHCPWVQKILDLPVEGR